MLFKSDKKRRRPGVALTMGALAMVGAVSLFNTSKRWVKDKTRKVVGMFRGMGGSDTSDN